jgi:alcohol dehydrogenase class IV
MAAWMSFSGVLSGGTGLSHAIGRVIGATWKIPHGITSCITLPEVMREEAHRQPKRLMLIAEAEGQQVTSMPDSQIAMSAAKGVQDLIDNLGLSKKLHDYGITSSDLPKIARECAPSENYEETMKILERIL